jgi:hypothetical protein
MKAEGFTPYDLTEYINRFPMEQRETVAEVIFKSKRMFEFFNTSQGMAITEDLVKMMADNVGRIVKITAEGRFETDFDKVRVAAEENATLYKLLSKWATLLSDGNKCQDDMKKKQ